MPRTRKLVHPASPGEEIGRAVQELFDITLCHEMDIHISMDNQYISYDLKDCRLTLPIHEPTKRDTYQEIKEYLDRCVTNAFKEDLEEYKAELEANLEAHGIYHKQHDGDLMTDIRALEYRLERIEKGVPRGPQHRDEGNDYRDQTWDNQAEPSLTEALNKRPWRPPGKDELSDAREGKCKSIAPIAPHVRCNGSEGHKGNEHHHFERKWKDDPPSVQKRGSPQTPLPQKESNENAEEKHERPSLTRTIVDEDNNLIAVKLTDPNLWSIPKEELREKIKKGEV